MNKDTYTPTRGWIIKKYKRDRVIYFDGIIYTDKSKADSILNRLSDEWDIEEVDIYD